MVAWHVTPAALVGYLVVAGVLVAVVTATIVLLRRGRRRVRQHGSARSLERQGPDSVMGVLAAAGSLPPDDAPGHADARESGPAVLRIDETEPPARCPACDRSLSEADAFCWRCGAMVADEEG